MFDGLLLSGTSEVSLDTKGRLLIPARYRDNLMDQNEGACVVTRSLFENCLWLYPVDEWDSVVATLGALPTLTDPLCRTIQRVILGSAVFCQLDVQGRILLPQELRELAGLKKCAYLIGFNNKFELWSEDSYKAQRDVDNKVLQEALKDLSSHSVLQGLKL
ncbi:MAG: division/cell wall cluster transcriptional repressor MraZ [Aeromonadales bacterium]|nr:division/cell wall cluster transcriptional repressor MraZ [Aeromonadales bacterium]